VIIPTIPGREDILGRCLSAFNLCSDGADIQLLVIDNKPSCGEAWLEGAESADGDYILLFADDLEVTEGWWLPLVEACDRGVLPCPIVRNGNGTLQSAGGDLAATNHLRDYVGDDWDPVGFTTVPFMSREQWDAIGMIPVHYFSDVWVSARGRQLGIETVLRTGTWIIHHNHHAGRKHSHGDDAATYERSLLEATPA
jgi:hypothetical protein